MIYHMAMSRKQVLVQLDDDLVAALDQLAESEGTNRSELLRRGARAVVRAAALTRDDEKLARAYAAQPQDLVLLDALSQQAAATLPAW